MNYKVGDKVIIRKWDDMEKEFGLDSDGDIKAKCCFVKSMREYCGKEMIIERYRGNGLFNMVGTNFNFSEDTFEKKLHQKIVITTDGKETLARLYDGDKVVKKATAKCSPDDTFDFNVGAKLAFERLTEKKEEPPKYYNGKAVCIETKPYFAYTVGKVYEFKDGLTTINNGCTVYRNEPVKSIDEWNKLHGSFAKMLEIVE